MIAAEATLTARPVSFTSEAQRQIRVAFQGELGAYSDQAIGNYWKEAATPVPATSFEAVVTEVAWGRADYGVIPVWNSVVGDVMAGCSAVALGRSAAFGLVVAGDTHVVVRHQLLVLPGTHLDEIEFVASHPVALAQCRRFLAEHPAIVPRPVYDTAGAARDLADHGTRRIAAIAGRLAAERYGLTILKSDIQDIPDNVTHFLVLTRPTYKHSNFPKPPASEIVRW